MNIPTPGRIVDYWPARSVTPLPAIVIAWREESRTAALCVFTENGPQTLLAVPPIPDELAKIPQQRWGGWTWPVRA